MTKQPNLIFNQLPKEAQDYIHRLEQVRTDFVANVSHELRTPLTVVRGYLESLISQEGIDKKVLNKIYAQMLQQSLRMTEIIEDLLLLAHLESDDHPLEEKEVLISTMLNALCLDAKTISGDKKHRIHLKADKKLYLYGAESELRSLFSNLIINAVKYTPEKGRIDIRWHQDEKGRALFSVKDTGIGIEQEHLPRLTERFYRVDKARSRERGGTGLGLAIVKHVLLRHDAKLEIDSRIGTGSVFTCIFPAKRVTLTDLKSD
jgi:two-component system phosphate regulon sensor histidine kinase PhoR